MKKHLKRLLIAVLSLTVMLAMGTAVFADDGNAAENGLDNSTTLADGEYQDATCTVKKASDGSETTVLTLQKIIVKDAKAEAVFKVDKNTKPHVYIGAENVEEDVPELYSEENGCGPDVYPVDLESLEVAVPVKLNADTHIAVRTKMKSSYKWVNYTYHITIEEPAWKPTQNQEKFAGIEYKMGMLSAASLGTSLTVNPDATITLHVTTKPMISSKYTKVAISTDPISKDNAEEIAATIPVNTFTAVDNYTNTSGKEFGPRSYYWSEFDYTVPVSVIGMPMNIWGYNVLVKTDEENSIYEEIENPTVDNWANRKTWTILETPELIGQLQTALESATSEDAKAAFNAVLSQTFYSDALVIDEIPAQTYTGEPLTPELTVKAGETTLEKDKDYTVEFSNNVDPGTATATVKGAGDYSGEKTISFTINKAPISGAAVSAIKAVTFNGKKQTPAVTVKFGSKTLAKGKDYTVAYKNNINAGKATVTLTGKGNYEGTKTASFTINPAAQKLTVSKAAKSVKFKTLKKKAAFTSKVVVNGAKTKVVTYAKVAKGSSKKLTINKKTGKIKVAKKTKKGTYKIKVKITAAKSANYKAASITKVIKVVVK